MRCELTFRLGRTHPAHARSSGLERLSLTRSLTGYTIDTHESDFSEATGRLAWISTERNSPHIMFTQRPIFQPFRSKTCGIRYPIWCSDNGVARSLFASHSIDSPINEGPDWHMTPRRAADQNTILANGKQQIPESYESLGDSNVSGILSRGNPG